MNIFSHATYVGKTGYNSHCQNFFRNLNKYHDVKIRNFTVGKNWNFSNLSEDAHKGDVEEQDKKMLAVQSLWESSGQLADYEIYGFNKNKYKPDLNIVLADVNHHYFYQDYIGPKIAYTVWENTLYPDEFFEQLKRYDQVWVPSEWQAEITVSQGINREKVKVVPEGVDTSLFYPRVKEKEDGIFRFALFGRWDARKGTKETIRAFKNVFGNNPKVELWLSVDNPFSSDGESSSENRLKKYDLECSNIKVLHFPSREDYVKILANSDVFLSCARSEGWNLPLIEAMACGIPSIYSNCSGQLEFAKDKGISVDVLGEISSQDVKDSYCEAIGIASGNWYEPDFKDLEKKILYSYENHKFLKAKALLDSEIIRKEFSWDNAARKADSIIKEFAAKYDKDDYSVSLSGVKEDQKSIAFTAKSNTTKKVIAEIIDEFSGLVFFKGEMLVGSGQNYFVSHAYVLPNQIFRISDFYSKEVKLEHKINSNFLLNEKDLKIENKNLSSLLPEKIKNHPSLGFSFFEIFHRKTYSFKNCKIESGDVVFDLGSCFGLFSRYAFLNGASEVHAFEPNKELVESNLILNKGFNFFFNAKAVHSKNVKFLEKEDLINSWVEESRTGEILNVDINSYIAAKNIKKIDYLKVDIEGAEYDLFENINKDFLANNVKKIAIEYHNNTNGQVQKILDVLESCGFTYKFESEENKNKELGMLYAWKFESFDSSKFYNENVKKENRLTWNFEKETNKLNFSFDCDYKEARIILKEKNKNLKCFDWSIGNITKEAFYYIVPTSNMKLLDLDFEGFVFSLYSNSNLVFEEKISVRNLGLPSQTKYFSSKETDLSISDSFYIQYSDFYNNKFLKSCLSGKKVVVDIGASCGSFVDICLQNGVDKVVALEPSKSFEILQKTFIDNKNVICLNKALSTDCSNKDFYSTENSTLSSFNMESQKKFDSANLIVNTYLTQISCVDLKTLKKTSGLESVDLLKMDIEGFEYDLFDSFDFADFDCVNEILIEYHHNEHKKVNSIIDKLKNFNYDVFLMNLNYENDFSLDNLQGVIHGKKKQTNATETKSSDVKEIVLAEAGLNKENFVFVTCGDLGYLSSIENLIKSLLEFSKSKIIIYGVDCDVPFDYPNIIKRRLSPERYSEHDKWYWKQMVCIESLSEDFSNFVWIDGDAIVNYNVDSIERYFSQIENYPISDIHRHGLEHFSYTDESGAMESQSFNENLASLFGVAKSCPYMHSCFFIYNHKCDWWFKEIINTYKSIDLNDYRKYLPWNDEGIDNVLRWKFGFKKHLPLSNFDVSSYDGDHGLTTNQLKDFYAFWHHSGPFNFNRVYGFQYISENKNDVIYFHGNKNPKIWSEMIDFIKMKRDDSFYKSEKFFTSKYELKNLGSIKEIEGSTLSVAERFGWDYAIYHEIYNLRDYYWNREKRINEGDIVVDLGGNMGIFNRWAYQQGAEKVISFEPDKRYFELLKKNSDPKSILFNAAVSDRMGEVQLFESSHLGGSNILSEDLNSNKYNVKSYTLDHLFSSNLIQKIDFLKIDVEGSEHLVFQGISDENLRKVKFIAMEYHHRHFNHDENLRNNLISRLANCGFISNILWCGNNQDLQLIYSYR